VGEAYGLAFLPFEAAVAFASAVKVTIEPTIPAKYANVCIKRR
jgi:hypothetical protein